MGRERGVWCDWMFEGVVFWGGVLEVGNLEGNALDWIGVSV